MQISFDLISDLWLDNNQLDWSLQATSPICVVAGNVAGDRKTVIDFLTHLSSCYQQVLYIDGDAEHKNYLFELERSLRDLKNQIAKIKNVQFLVDNVVIINGVAFVGTNGWWSFDFDPCVDATQTAQWYLSNLTQPCDIEQIILSSLNDAAYLGHAIEKLQILPDVRKIVVVSHTVPTPTLIEHDVDLIGSYKFNVMGNQLLDRARNLDTESKITTWCFGHYHGSVDQSINQVQYVNNCRGQLGSNQYQYAYYAKKIVVSY